MLRPSLPVLNLEWLSSQCQQPQNHLWNGKGMQLRLPALSLLGWSSLNQLSRPATAVRQNSLKKRVEHLLQMGEQSHRHPLEWYGSVNFGT